MKRIIQRTLLVSLGAILILAITSVSLAQSKTFVYCSEGSPSSLNPQLASDGATFNITRQIYNRLVEFRYGETEIYPSLAQSYKVSKDNLTFTFKLRKGVKWHRTSYFTPTRDFNADDVVFTFERMMDKNHPFHKVGGGIYEYFDSMDMRKILKEVKKIDDYTVQFALSKPEAPFLANIAMDFASILSKEYADKVLAAKTPDKLDNYPVGTGPFVFQSYQKDTMVRMDKNPNYFRGAPKLDKIVVLITVDANVRTQKLRAGECHLIAEPSPSDIPSLKANKSLVVMSRPGLNVGYLSFNVEKKPFDNPLVRRAIHYAVNRKTLIDAVYLGNAQIAKNPIPPTIWSYNEAIKDYEYSVEKAKKLLKQAGLENGFETELWTLPVSRPYLPNGKKAGELMQADLAKVGIKVKLVTYDWPTYLDKTAKGEHQMFQMGWTGDNGDPDNFLYVLLSCAAVQGTSNRSRWCYKPYDELVTKAKQTVDLKTRVSLYKKAQEIFKDQVPWVPLAHSTVYRAMSTKVKNYKIDPFGGEYFERLDLQ